MVLGLICTLRTKHPIRTRSKSQLTEKSSPPGCLSFLLISQLLGKQPGGLLHILFLLRLRSLNVFSLHSYSRIIIISADLFLGAFLRPLCFLPPRFLITLSRKDWIAQFSSKFTSCCRCIIRFSYLLFLPFPRGFRRQS